MSGSAESSENKQGNASKVAPTERFIDVSAMPFKEFQGLAKMSQADREMAIHNTSKQVYSHEEVVKIAPMTWYEELTAVCLFLFGVPGSVITFPVIIIACCYIFNENVKMVLTIAFAVAVTLALLPAPFVEKSLSSWYALQLLKYFSFKGIFEQPLDSKKPYILVAPPHGVFPFGNIATMIAFPSIMGFSFRALAASAAIRMPFFRQLLCTIGAIDASRSTATKALNKNLTLGISTGGIAEMFETSPDGDEVIVLKNRQGLVKLAFRTGAALVPCYLLGNTHLLSWWCGGPPDSKVNRFLQMISRKTGIALIAFWGRFLLPIPYRVPIVGIMSKPIEVPKKDNPTDEEIQHYHNILLDEMVKLFDKHKAAYGWGNKRLIIR